MILPELAPVALLDRVVILRVLGVGLLVIAASALGTFLLLLRTLTHAQACASKFPVLLAELACAGVMSFLFSVMATCGLAGLLVLLIAQRSGRPRSGGDGPP